MSIVQGKLSNQTISGVDSISNFSQAARTFVSQFNVCPARPAFDQFGRPSGYGALNTLNAPGCFSPMETILNENSLRPVLASQPLYKNVQSGVGIGSADTLFGMRTPGRGNAFQQVFTMQAGNPSAKCITSNPGAYMFPPEYAASKYNDLPCNNQNFDALASFVGGSSTSDGIKYAPRNIL